MFVDSSDFDTVVVAILEIARAALTRFGRPTTPPAPEVGEVGELVAALKEPGDPFPEYRTITGEQADRIATLLQRQESRIANLRSALADCGQATGAAIGDDYSDAFLLQEVPAEVRLAVTEVAIPGEQWHEDGYGTCLWWRFPIEEPPWCGDPRDGDWPGYHTHFTRISIPLPQAGEGEA
jgi:hypothetical protein